ncbi:MAG: hypothetical protein FP815_14645 [Desulfobulbaceae bacterium]|nr:hypothetical protein [Desulfobulbaceae bacterium]MDP2107318.1 hypothetical protein [Desulfobulbaceae bacterium]
MLPPRKNRIPLEKDPEAATFPTIMVALSENSSVENNHEISILDINNAGIGIACSVPLRVGQRIFFKEDHPEWEFPKHGIVMWTFKNSGEIRAGIKFA